MKWIYLREELLWRARRFWPWVKSWFSVVSFLNRHAATWRLEKHDWPDYWVIDGKTYGASTPYVCRVYGFFFARGTGRGRTPREAAKRAVAHFERVSARQYREDLANGTRVTWEEFQRLLSAPSPEEVLEKRREPEEKCQKSE